MMKRGILIAICLSITGCAVPTSPASADPEMAAVVALNARFDGATSSAFEERQVVLKVHGADEEVVRKKVKILQEASRFAGASDMMVFEIDVTVTIVAPQIADVAIFTSDAGALLGGYLVVYRLVKSGKKWNVEGIVREVAS